MRQALISKQLTAPLFRYSQLIKAGPNYFCSGMIALDNDGLGSPSHISDLLSISNCDAIAMADYLHMKRGNIQELKNSNARVLAGIG